MCDVCLCTDRQTWHACDDWFYTGLLLQRPPLASMPTSGGEAQMALCTLRTAELLADDSNLRQ
jgi:hypothetical protein